MSTSHYASATIVRIVALVLNALGTFFLFPYILHTIGEHDFGIWSMAASITSYMLLIDFGISLACTRFLSLSITDKKQWQRIITNAVSLSVVLMLLFVVLGLGLLILRYFNINIISDSSLGFVVGILAIETGISMVLRVYQSVLRTDLNFLQLGLFEIFRVILRLIGFPLIIMSGGGLFELVIYSATVNILFFLCSYIYVRLVHKQTFFSTQLISFSMIKELFDFGKFAIIVQAVDLFRYRLDGVFIGFTLGIASIAQYAILITAIDMAVQVLSRFLSYWETIIIRHTGGDSDDQSMDYLFKSMTIGFWITALFIGNFYLLGELFLTLWVGEKYAHLADELTLLSSLLLLITFQMSISPYLNGHGKQKIDAGLTLIEVMGKTIFAIPMLHSFGFKGLMVTTLVSGITVSLFGRFFVVARVSGQPYSSLMIRLFKNIIPVFLVIIVLALTLMLTRHLNLGLLTTVAIMISLQAVALILALYYFQNKRMKVKTKQAAVNSY